MTYKKRLAWFILSLVLVSCAGRKTQPIETYPGQQPPPYSGNPPPQTIPPPVSTEPMGPNPIPIPQQVEDSTKKTPENPPREAPRVALVVGGAGIASFATVGLLKRFQEENISVDLIVATGWPTLFSLGYGFMRSVHDLEWFAMRLQEKDFKPGGGLFEKEDRLSGLIENSFPQKDLADTRVPIIISMTSTLPGEEIAEKGDWKNPLLKTLSLPGLYREFPAVEDRRVKLLLGLDVSEAIRRGAKTVIAVEMYDDYFKPPKGQKKETLGLRAAYVNQLKKSLTKEMQQALITGRIVLDKAPNDFAAKRLAIFAGYKEAARLAKLLRSQLNDN